MSNIINDITNIYYGQIAESSHLETDMKKRRENNEKAIEDIKNTKANRDMVNTARKKFDEEAEQQIDEISADLALRASKEAGKRAGILSSLSGNDKKVIEKAKKKRSQAERLYSNQAKKRAVTISPIKEEEVEEETKAERYKRLMSSAATPAQKKAQERARKGRELLADIQTTERELKKGKVKPEAKPEYNTPEAEVRRLKPGQKTDTLAMKAKRAMKEEKNAKRWWDDDGDGIGYEKGEVSGKFKKDKKKKSVKEGYSDWRSDLKEIVSLIEKNDDEPKISEKKVKNKIKINPSVSEAVENIGGNLLEMIEIDEIDYIIESAYDELLNEGYSDEDIEDAIEYALTEANVTFGHDTETTPEKKKEGLVSVARKRLSGFKKKVKQSVATGARKLAKGALGVARKMEGGDKTPSSAHTKERKASSYRGQGVGQKERVSSGSYTPPKKMEKPSDPWEGSYTSSSDAKTKSKAKSTKASSKRSKSSSKRRVSKLDDLLTSIRSEDFSLDEKTLTDLENKTKESYVKSMKNKLSDFEKRYPGRGKEVMYATATKMAKKIAEQALNVSSNDTQNSDKSNNEKKIQQNQSRMRQQEVQILQRKLQAIRSAPKGTDPSITAGYELEGDVISERRRDEKGTPRKSRNPAFELISKSMGNARVGVQERGKKKIRGEKKVETTPVERFKRSREFQRNTSKHLYSSPRD